jgi:hypothetical protein
MKTELFSHNNAQTVIDPSISHQVLTAVRAVDIVMEKNCRDVVRDAILQDLQTLGWSGKFRLDAHSNISLTSSFGENVLCFQTGNMSRFYADLLKLQYVFSKGNAKCAIYIVFSKEAAKTVGSNLAHFDRLVRELQLFGQIITMPILVIGIG